ncbi:MAG: ABC transporter substrate-binding protein [Ignavibacteriales bacterium]|nr:ABC transporter substrate-binding protein [Ignavibacteriales bacterium]
MDFIPIRDSSGPRRGAGAGGRGRGPRPHAAGRGAVQGEDRASPLRAKPGVSFADLRFGFKKGIFMNNPKLRQAVGYAIDKEEIVKAVTFGLGKAAPAGIPIRDPVLRARSARERPVWQDRIRKRPSSS